MDIEIKALTPELEDDYFDFFDNRAFTDDSPYSPCYCNAFNMSKDMIAAEIFDKSKEYGGGKDGLKKALRESAVRMVRTGKIRGYLAFSGGKAVGWCNSNDRLSYFRVGEFDTDDTILDEAIGDSVKPGQIRSVVCFEIAPGYRGQGIATRLLERVCSDAAADGYEAVEVYPEKHTENVTLAFTGTVHLYEKAGFVPVAEKGKTLIMRKDLK